MVALGFGLVWLGWSAGLWGYCLVRGYDVTLTQLVSPGYRIAWPPPLADNTVIIPSGLPSGGKSTTAASAGGAPSAGTPPPVVM
jgi:hypothetical protein